MKIKNILIVFLLSTVQMLVAQDKVGTSAAPFLGINIGSAASAMGGAYVSMVNDASALYWNPGIASRLNSTEISFMHSDWFLDTKYIWGAAILDLGSGMAIGVQLAYLDYGEEEVTTVDEQDGNGQRWSAQDLYLGLTLARNFTDRFSIGGTIKYIEQQIFHESASAVAFDVGLLYVTGFNGMRLGMSISNFGSDMQMDGKDLFHQYDPDPDVIGNNGTLTSKLKTDEWPIPLIFRVGVSMEVFEYENTSFTVSSDAIVPSDNSTNLNLGAQVGFFDAFFIRGGYKSVGQSGNEAGISAGIGFKYFVPGLSQVKLDYAFNNYGIIDDVHIIGFGFSL